MAKLAQKQNRGSISIGRMENPKKVRAREETYEEGQSGQLVDFETGEGSDSEGNFTMTRGTVQKKSTPSTKAAKTRPTRKVKKSTVSAKAEAKLPPPKAIGAKIKKYNYAGK